MGAELLRVDSSLDHEPDVDNANVGNDEPLFSVLFFIGGKKNMDYIKKLRQLKPLIHNITNYVTVNDVANAILAIGGSPIMSDEIDEVAQMTSISHALNINIGTLNKVKIASMLEAGKASNACHHITVLDPVGAGATDLRTETCQTFLNQIHFDAIKGNISEIKTLMAGTGHTKGVDASAEDQKNSHDLIDDIKQFAEELHTIIIVTGPVDYVTDGHKCYMINNGCKEMSTITGTGCMLSGILPCFLAVENSVDSAAAAVMAMGLAGEIGASRLAPEEGNATLRTYIIDALYNMTDELLEKGGKYEIQ